MQKKKFINLVLFISEITRCEKLQCQILLKTKAFSLLLPLHIREES